MHKVSLYADDFLLHITKMQKSEVFPFNPTALNIPASMFPFKRLTSNFNYQQDLERWHTLPLSLAGRINLLKMNVIPKFIYLFQNFPVFFFKKKFSSLDRIFSNLIWDGRQPA